MRPDTAVLPPRFLRTKEAAEFLSLSARTLEKHRTYGTGPAYRKLGGRVVYSVDDLETWADRGAVTSTSDPRGSVLPAKRQTPSTGQPVGRLLEKGDAAQECALARARGADQAGDGAARHREVDAVEHAGGAEILDEARDPDGCALHQANR